MAEVKVGRATFLTSLLRPQVAIYSGDLLASASCHVELGAVSGNNPELLWSLI